MINIYNLNDSLAILIRDDSVFEQLKSDFPDILADLVTFKGNANCSCRGRVVKFFGDKLTQDANILEKYIKNPSALNEELQSLQVSRIANNYSGKVITIDKGEAAWQTFSQSIIGKVFRSFSVVEQKDSLEVYFL